MKTSSRILAIVVVTLQTSIIWGAEPSAFTHLVQTLDLVVPVVPEGIDVQALLAEDARRDPEGGPYRFAIRRSVMVTPQTDGIWEDLGGDMMLWRVPIASPGAVSLSLGFTRYSMPAGGQLFIYSPDYLQVRGPYTVQDNKEHGHLWTPLLYGDSIVVELTIPLVEVPDLTLELTAVNHGYRGHNPFSTTKDLGTSGGCNMNVACPAGDNWRDQIRSVAWYEITDNGWAYWGSGALINNTRQNDKWYFLTAFHCLDLNDDGILDPAEKKSVHDSMILHWKYEASTCTGTIPHADETQSGATLVAAYQPTDFALMELSSAPPTNANVYYAGWDRSDTVPSQAVAIHHPQFDLKKISFEDHRLSVTSYYSSQSPGDGTCLRVANWEVGTTERVSSGCPLFNPDKRIVGQLRGGDGGCSGSVSNRQPDWFGRLQRSWTGGGTSTTRLSDWLDPANTGVMALDGKNPGCPARISGYVLTGPAPSLPPDGGELILEPDEGELILEPDEGELILEPDEGELILEPDEGELILEPVEEEEILPVSGVLIVANPGGRQTVSNSDGSFDLAVPCGWSGTLSASLRGWAFDIAPQSFTNVVSPVAASITAHAVPITTVTIFGYVTYPDWTGIDGVTVETDDGLSTWTGFDGYYAIEVPSGWSGRVHAYETSYEETGYTFSPDRSPYFSNLTSNQRQDFVGQRTLTISGHVTLGGWGLSGVEIETDDYGGPSTTTDARGYYELVIPFVGFWSGKVIPSKDGYEFTPPYKQYGAITYDRQTDFTADLSHPATVTISGYVNEGWWYPPNPASGVTLTAGPGGYTATTNSSGDYSLVVPWGWSGTVTPSGPRPGSFTPSSQYFFNVTSDETAESIMVIWMAPYP